MRSSLVAMALLSAGLAAAPAWSQSWSGTLPTVPGTQGQGVLTFDLPEVNGLESWTLFIAYDKDLFEPLSPASFTAPYDFAFPDTVGPPSTAVAADFAGLTGAEVGLLNSGQYDEVIVSVSAFYSPVFPLNHPGGDLFSVTFEATPRDLNAGPVTTTVFASFNYDEIGVGDPAARFTTTIAAVPEPETWAMMLSGLALVGVWSARRRKPLALA